MLIRLEGARRTMGVRDAVAAAREAGRKYISVASEVLGRKGRVIKRTDHAITNKPRSPRPRQCQIRDHGQRHCPCEVRVGEGRPFSVVGTSIMGLMMLGAAMGDSV